MVAGPAGLSVAEGGDVLASRLALSVDTHFEELVMTYQSPIYAFALRLTGRHADAQEVAQDTFLRAYRGLHRLTPEQRAGLRVRPWLYRISINLCRNRFRRRRPQETELPEAMAAAGPGPEEEAQRREREKVLVAGLSRLPAARREAIVLRHVAGLGYLEIAAATGRPVGSVKSDVHRAAAELRRWLSAAAPELFS